MNKWIYFLPQFAMLFPCCSKNPLCPWTRILSRAVSSAWNSASDSSTFQEPRFSRILPWFLDPGIGTTFGYLCSIQLNEIWALVAAFFSAYSSSSASTGWFASIFSLRSCGTNLRTSSLWEKSEFTVTFPERKPLAVGENGTSSMLCSMQYGITASSAPRSTME